MATFYTKEAGHVQLEPVDGTFDLPILAQLLAYLEDYAWVFPDERFPQERRTTLGRLQSPGLGLTTGHFSEASSFPALSSRSEHTEPVEGRSRRLLRRAQDASARLFEKVSGRESSAQNNYTTKLTPFQASLSSAALTVRPNSTA